MRVLKRHWIDVIRKSSFSSLSPSSSSSLSSSSSTSSSALTDEEIWPEDPEERGTDGRTRGAGVVSFCTTSESGGKREREGRRKRRVIGDNESSFTQFHAVSNFPGRAMVQDNQESPRKYWATCSSVCSSTYTAHSVTHWLSPHCSPYSLPSLWDSEWCPIIRLLWTIVGWFWVAATEAPSLGAR